MKRVFTFFVLFLLCIACKDTDTKESQIILSFDKEGVVLNHDDLLLSNYLPVSSKIVGRDSLMIFDFQSRQIVIFSLKSTKPIWSHKFDKEGPDFIDLPVLDVNLQGDSITVLSNHYFSLYNFDGKCVYRIGVGEISGMNSSFSLIDVNFINQKRALFSKLSFSALGFKIFQPLDKAIFTELDLTNSKLTDWNLNYPNEALIDNPDKSFKNFSRHHTSIVSKEKLVFNFEFSSTIYEKEISFNSLKKFPAESEFTKNIRTPYLKGFTRKESTKNRFTGPSFSRVHYDSTTGYYIRTHIDYTLLPYVAENGSDIKAEKYLMVFDKNFNVLSEIQIPDKFSSRIMVNNGKIYFWKGGEPEKENTHELIVYTINSD